MGKILDMTTNCFIDGVKYQVHLRLIAFQEVVNYINSLDLLDYKHHPINMVVDDNRGIKN